MKLDDKVTLVFKDDKGGIKEIVLTVRDAMEKSLDEIYDYLESECTSSSCNNESQNFCDCGSIYDDYYLIEVIPITKK